MKPPFRLVLGTSNPKKRTELVCLIEGQPIEIVSLAEFSGVTIPAETGDTFAANAELKAVHYATELDHWVLAEDSGLSVRVLDGAPGVYSARYAGEEATDADNNRRLLEKLAGIPSEQRAAWYTCHIVLSDPQGMVHARSEATCAGRIIDVARGQYGFGYDPLFEIPEYHRTFAELGDSVKAILSHRARAWRRLLPKLTAIVRAEMESGATS